MSSAVRRSSAATLADRPAVDGRRAPAPTPTACSSTKAAVAANHIRSTRGVQLVEPAAGGAAAGRRPGRCCRAARSTRRQAATVSDAPRVVLGQVPGPPERRRPHRRRRRRSSRSSASIDRHARGSSPQARSPATTGGHQLAGPGPGRSASTSRACSRSSHAWQSLRLSRGSASQAASSRVGARVVADGLRQPGPGRVHRPQVVAVAAEDLARRRRSRPPGRRGRPPGGPR